MGYNLQQREDTSKAVEMQVVMPLELGIAIEMDDPVRLLIEMTERLDYRELNAAYVRPPRADEATPKQMFQLVILGFMAKEYATRQLEAACRHEHLFVDGTKIKANANRYSFVWAKSVSKHEARLDGMLWHITLIRCIINCRAAKAVVRCTFSIPLSRTGQVHTPATLANCQRDSL